MCVMAMHPTALTTAIPCTGGQSYITTVNWIFCTELCWHSHTGAYDITMAMIRLYNYIIGIIIITQDSSQTLNTYKCL